MTITGLRGASGAAFCGMLALALVVTLGLPAEAHVVSERVTTYFSQDNCQDTRSEVSHGGGGGYSRADSIALRFNRPLGWACAENYVRPAGYHAAKFDLYRWNGSDWVLCWSSAWMYNSTNTHRYWIYRDFGSSPPCGSGYYGTYSGTFHYHGSQWYGGWVWSGNHWLPA